MKIKKLLLIQIITMNALQEESGNIMSLDELFHRFIQIFCIKK